jgi:hypothetical protein
MGGISWLAENGLASHEELCCMKQVSELSLYHEINYTLFIACFCLRNCGVTPRVKVHHSDPSEDRSFRTVWQLKQAYEPHRKMFKALKEWKTQHASQCFCKDKTLKNTNIWFWSVVNYCHVAFREETPAKGEGWVYKYVILLIWTNKRFNFRTLGFQWNFRAYFKRAWNNQRLSLRAEFCLLITTTTRWSTASTIVLTKKRGYVCINVTPRFVRIVIFAVQKQKLEHTLRVCL